jgi:hypothetical protein
MCQATALNDTAADLISRSHDGHASIIDRGKIWECR